MATYTVRGSAHNVVYTYRLGGTKKQIWETYYSELEAMQRKCYIDYLQKHKQVHELEKAASEYRQRKSRENDISRLSRKLDRISAQSPANNSSKTYREFAEKWLPFHARKKQLSPNTYDSYRSNLDVHILPYFGDWIMSTITTEAIDDFMDMMRQKPCRGYGARHAESGQKTLSSGSIKKCYTVLTAGFETAKAWGYIQEIPVTTPPAEKYKKRKAIMADQARELLDSIQDDPLLHLAVHFAFVNSMRAGEIAGIGVDSFDFANGSMWLGQQLQRVSDESLDVLSVNAVIRVFPKQLRHSRSYLVLKGPKSGISTRKLYLTRPLMQEIQERIKAIDENKRRWGKQYHDYGLLLCHDDGSPIEPSRLERSFKEHQRSLGIPKDQQVELQGLRKSGEMHKIRLTQNNFQLVAESGGHSPEVLMSHYNEALESEKRAMYQKVEQNFYDASELGKPAAPDQSVQLLETIQQSFNTMERLMQILIRHADHAP